MPLLEGSPEGLCKAEPSRALLWCTVTDRWQHVPRPPWRIDEHCSAGGIDRLVALLSAQSGKAREAAAMALYHMSMASPGFCTDTFNSLCNAMLHARGEAAVLAALDSLFTAGATEGLAATYLTNVGPV